MYNKQHLEQTGIFHLEPLVNIEELEELNIIGTEVESIAPLIELPNLEKLELSAGRIPQSEIERFMFTHPACDVIIKPRG